MSRKNIFKILFPFFILALLIGCAAQKASPTEAPPPPPPVEEMKKAPGIGQNLLEKGRATLNIEFDYGRAIVKPKYYKDIQSVAEVMKKYPDIKIIVEGHTDNVGGKEYNFNLSQKRAEAVIKVMVTKFDIKPSRLTAKGFGFSRPIEHNATEEGRQKNRRVEVSIDNTIKR